MPQRQIESPLTLREFLQSNVDNPAYDNDYSRYLYEYIEDNLIDTDKASAENIQSCFAWVEAFTRVIKFLISPGILPKNPEEETWITKTFTKDQINFIEDVADLQNIDIDEAEEDENKGPHIIYNAVAEWVHARHTFESKDIHAEITHAKEILYLLNLNYLIIRQ